jgi:hypothetical protein
MGGGKGGPGPGRVGAVQWGWGPGWLRPGTEGPVADIQRQAECCNVAKASWPLRSSGCCARGAALASARARAPALPGDPPPLRAGSSLSAWSTVTIAPCSSCNAPLSCRCAAASEGAAAAASSAAAASCTAVGRRAPASLAQRRHSTGPRGPAIGWAQQRLMRDVRRRQIVRGGSARSARLCGGRRAQAGSRRCARPGPSRRGSGDAVPLAAVPKTFTHTHTRPRHAAPDPRLPDKDGGAASPASDPQLPSLTW